MGLEKISMLTELAFSYSADDFWTIRKAFAKIFLLSAERTRFKTFALETAFFAIASPFQAVLSIINHYPER
jgi:hypothetical protein